MRLIAAIAFVLASILPVLAQDTQSAGRAQSEAFLAGDIAGVWEDMAPPMQEAFGTIEGLQQFRDSLTRDFGEEVEVVSEQVQPGDGVEAYLRTSKWSNIEPPLLFDAVTATRQLDHQRVLVGLLIESGPEGVEDFYGSPNNGMR